MYKTQFSNFSGQNLKLCLDSPNFILTYIVILWRTKGWEVIICIETCFQYFIGSGLHAFDVLSKTCNPEQIFANFASQKFCENGGEENELKKWLKSAKN